MKTNKESIIGKNFKEVFGIWSRPYSFRTLLKNHRSTLERLSKDDYKLARLKTIDQKRVIHVLQNIKYFEYMADIKLNTKGVIIFAPAVRVYSSRK